MIYFLKKIGLVLFLLGVLNACATSDSVNKQAAVSYVQVVKQQKEKGTLDTQSATSQRIEHVFKRLLPVAKRYNNAGHSFAWEMTVIRSDDLNAFALPGGKMVFSTALVETLALSDDEIAVVVGHEMAHALKEHGLKKVNLNMAGSVVVNLLSVGLAVAGYGGELTDMSLGLTKGLALDMPFSRSNEKEADEIGLFLMAEAGYQPEAALTVWRKMEAHNKTGNHFLVNLLSTHPTNKDREDNLRKLLPKAKVIYQTSQANVI